MKTLSAAVFSAMLCSSSYAAGLGKLTVLSSLGQPLRAEIELTSVSKDESGVLFAKLASTEAYRQANIDFNPVLFSLRFAIEKRDQRQFIRITSSQPVNEPFVDMLLELGGTNNRLVREYTFLLDPADLRMKQSAQIAAPAVVPAPRPVQAAAAAAQPAQASATIQASKQPGAEAQKSEKPAPSKKAVPENKQAATENKDEASPSAVGTYQVKKGDSLLKIANRFKPEGVSLDQMLVALFSDNPKAFDAQNMNRVRAGQILSIPDASSARSIEDTAARGVIVAQAADFNKYRNKLAAQVKNADAQKTAESKQSAAGKITAKVEEQKNPANDAKDKLKLSAPGVASGAASEKSAAMAAGAEELIAKDKALAEANLRVKELEKNVSDLQKILEIKTNRDLADQQKQADLAKAASAASAKAPVAATPAAVPAAAPAPAPAPAVVVAVAPAIPIAASAPDAAKPADVKVETPPSAAATVAAQPAPAKPEISFLDGILGNSVLLSSLGGVLLLGLGAFGIASARRKKQGGEFENSTLTDMSLKANSLFGSTGGQSVDTSNSVFNSNFAPTASQLDTNEVDPVAEADVYIAYGRDAQAEEILKEALRTQPDRNAVRVKLLEIYANRKDLRAFEILASELYSMTKGEGQDWVQAATLGLSIDPKNPLYAGGKPPESVDGESAVLPEANQPADDIDLDSLLTPTLSDTVTEEPNKFGSTSSYFDNSVAEIQAPVLPEISDDLKGNVSPVAESVTANGLDFDLDGFNIPQNEEKKAVPEAAPMDFELDGFSIPKVEEKKAEPVAAAPMDFDFGDLDFALPESGHAATLEPAPVDAAAAHDLSVMPAELSSLDVDFVAVHQETKSADPLSLDLSGICLDLNPARPSPAVDALELNVADHVLDDQSFSNSEMATKMDLAIAYQEIGDKDGARELLDEVINGGTGEQSEKAKSMLAMLV